MTIRGFGDFFRVVQVVVDLSYPFISPTVGVAGPLVEFNERHDGLPDVLGKTGPCGKNGRDPRIADHGVPKLGTTSGTTP